MTWTRLDDGWTDRPDVGDLTLSARWHLLALIQWCSRMHIYEKDIYGHVVRPADARRCSDVEDPRSALDELVASGHVGRDEDGSVWVVGIAEHLPAVHQRDEYRKAEQRKRKRKQREAEAVTAHVTRDVTALVTRDPGTGLRPVPSSSENVRDRASTARPEPARTDVETLCRRTLELVQANGFTKAKVTEEWRKSARLLLDRDGVELQTALALIEWATGHDFWHQNIRSVPKFREQYERLMVQAKADPRWRTTPGAVPDDQVDVDAILGKDLWRPEAPADIEFGDPATRTAWYRDAVETRKAERLELAKTRLAARRERGSA